MRTINHKCNKISTSNVILVLHAVNIFIIFTVDITFEVIYFSTTMGLKYLLKKFHSQWPFSMAIGNDFMTIFGKDCHIWNTALFSLLSSL